MLVRAEIQHSRHRRRSGFGLATGHPRSDGPIRALATAKWPARPANHIVSEAIPVFFIARNRDCFWVARAADARTGGIFLTKRSALLFAKRNSQPLGCATIFLAERFELDIRNQGNRFADPLSAIKRALADLVPKALQKLLATSAQARADMRRNRTAIEKDLLQGHARHTTKNDDDLPMMG